MRILIAEDDSTSRIVLASVLRSQGYQVTSAVDGAEAWTELQKPDAPTLVILDWLMPGLDGLEVVRRLRTAQDASRPPYVLMLTSRTEKADIIAGFQAGANDYLSKPFNPGELLARVEVGRRMVELQATLAGKIEELHQAFQELKILHGILPICMHCKKIRNDQGYWKQIEAYLAQYSHVRFSHGICPECMATHYPDVHENPDNLCQDNRNSV